MTRSYSYLIAAFAVLVAANSATAADPKPPEGEWAVQLKPSPNNSLKGTTEAYPDTITIKDGKFVTEVNAKYGFEPVAVSVKTMKGKTYVIALLNDEKHGKTEYQLIFSGKEGKEVSGGMRWGKQGEDGTAKYAEYSVAGMKK